MCDDRDDRDDCIRVIGCDSANALVLLANNIEILRTLDDFKRLNRAVNHSTGLPAESIKKILAHSSWRKNGQNWKMNMIKSINIIEKWLNELSTSNRQSLTEFLNDEEQSRFKKSRIERKEREERSKELQQFFTSHANIEQLVQLALANIAVSVDQVLFIEPSCGDGRILSELIAQGGRKLIGCDVDPLMQEPTSALIASHSMDDVQFQYYCQDFLTTTRKSLFDKFEASSNDSQAVYSIVIGNPPYSIVKTNEAFNINVDETDSSKFDYSNSDRQDYPFLFLLHCARTLKVNRIVFVLPDRCNDTAFVAKLENRLNSDNEDGHCWSLKTSIPSIDNSFELLGRSVKQPAIVQVWERS